MPQDEFTVSRRTALRFGAVVAWSVGTLAVASTQLAAAPMPRPKQVGAASDVVKGPRYHFDCFTPVVPKLGPLGRLEEVWASPLYLTFTDCVVSYAGAEAFALTKAEAAVVHVAEHAGASGHDPKGLFLQILAASTRIDPARFDAKLAELGRPVVTASLALAPDAPQAARFAAWLELTA
jgi:hypothetical protein